MFLYWASHYMIGADLGIKIIIVHIGTNNLFLFKEQIQMHSTKISVDSEMEIDEEDDDDTMVDPDYVAAMDRHVHVDSDSTYIDGTPHATYDLSYDQSQSSS